jgi:hypothetical protein
MTETGPTESMTNAAAEQPSQTQHVLQFTIDVARSHHDFYRYTKVRPDLDERPEMTTTQVILEQSSIIERPLEP